MVLHAAAHCTCDAQQAGVVGGSAASGHSASGATATGRARRGHSAESSGSVVEARSQTVKLTVPKVAATLTPERI